jgi:hypothetical protein
MEKLFKIPFPQRRRPATSPSAEGSVFEDGDVRQQRVQRVGLSSKTDATTKASSTSEKASSNANVLSSRQTSTRPTRSTRASGHSYDEDQVVDVEPAQTKYSVEVGLGPQWDK